MSTLSRRGALGLFGGASVPVSTASAAPGIERTDVCIIGAGYAGLSAAWALKKAGLRVVVLEARNRVGGRSLSGALKGGGWIDLGAQWVGPTQDRFYALIEEMGGETYPSTAIGDSLVRGLIDPTQMVRTDDGEKAQFPGSDLLDAAMKKFDALGKEIDPERPWTHPDAERLDHQLFADWLRENVENENVRASFGALVSSAACANTRELSTLSIATLVRACNGLDTIFDDEGGAQQDRVIGGTQFAAKKLAQKLGKSIRLGQKARRLRWTDKDVTVHCDTLAVTARKAIVCTPPSLAGALEYDPSPPTARVQVTQRWPQGLVIKMQVIYAEPFWRAAGLDGSSLDHLSLVGETADGGFPEKHSRKGVLTCFIYADQARKAALWTPAERQARVLADLALRFGEKAKAPLDFHEMNWSTQQWTRGCFTGFLAPGATTMFTSAVRDPVGPIHWACSENSTVWPSFIEGAIRSGEREAAAVLKGLR